MTESVQPIFENAYFHVVPHRKPVSDQTYACSLKSEELTAQYPTFMDVLEASKYDPNDPIHSMQPLKDMFNAIAAAAEMFDDPKKLFWLINATDDRVTSLNTTHSQGSYPHVHIVGGKLNEDKQHILTEKSYTPDPKLYDESVLSEEEIGDNPVFAKRNQNEPCDIETYEVPEECKESPDHFIIANIFCANFQDFLKKSSDHDLEVLKDELLRVLQPLIPQGGARVIYDEKFYPTGQFTMRIQGGDQKHKWFEKPQPPPLPAPSFFD